MRGLQFEWLIATHLARRKFSVDFPSAEQGTFDLLVRREDSVAEFECKSVSEKGQRIHRRETLEIFALMQAALKPLLKSLNQGLMIRVIVPQRFPSVFAERQQLCQSVRRVLLSGKSQIVEEHLEIRISHFNAAGTPLEQSPPEMSATHEFLRQAFGVDNKHLLVTSLGQPFVLSLESREPDNVVESIMNTVRDRVILYR